MIEQLKRAIWRRWPQRMPAALRTQILAQSDYICSQTGQGEPMVVMHRDDWEAGRYRPLPGAPFNRAGEDWIIRQWLHANPDWRP